MPERTAAKGRTPVRLKASTPSYKVLRLASGLDETSWKEFHISNTSNGNPATAGRVKKVYTWDGKSSSPRQELQVVRRVTNEKGVHEYKCSLANVPEARYGWLELAQVQAQRYFVERSFQETKGQAGMSEYQVRGWLAWHHYMVMVMTSMYFVLFEKMRFAGQYPMLSAYDVRQIIIHTYASKINSNNNVVSQIENTHR